MNTKPIPEGYHTVTPFLLVTDAPKIIEFLKQGFQAEEMARATMPDGTVMNAEIKIGDSMVMIAEARREHKAMPTMLYLYVKDADETYRQAVKAGGKSVLEPMDQFYGDRAGAVEDSSGNQWWIATRKENVPNEELLKRAASKRK